VVVTVAACPQKTDVMRHQLSQPAAGAAAAILSLALVACFNAPTSEAAATGHRIGTSDSDIRHYGNQESVIESPASRIENHLFLSADDDNNEDSVGLTGNDDEEEDDTDLNEVKRKWGQSNPALWGKRGLAYATNVDDVLTTKRKWGQKNMALWGKRAGRVAADKRKWGHKNMALWGRK